jgi:transcriptional regulator with XRE-family HTH domain
MGEQVPKEAKNRFAKRLRACLDASGLRRTDLAARLGVSKNTVTAWTTAASFPSALHMVGIAQILGVTVEELVAESGLGGDQPRPALATRPQPALDARGALDVLAQLVDEVEGLGRSRG